jgi:hypothetical protein
VKIASIVERQRLGRKVQGSAAALLPFEGDGRIAVAAFQEHLLATHRAGLMNAVNMDTGYVNYLSETEKLDVLRWTREALGKAVPFIAGAYIEGQTGDVVDLYRKQMDAIVAHGGIPILFPPVACTESLPWKRPWLIRPFAVVMRTSWLSNWEKCSRRTAKF